MSNLPPLTPAVEVGQASFAPETGRRVTGDSLELIVSDGARVGKATIGDDVPAGKETGVSGDVIAGSVEVSQETAIFAACGGRRELDADPAIQE